VVGSRKMYGAIHQGESKRKMNQLFFLSLEGYEKALQPNTAQKTKKLCLPVYEVCSLQVGIIGILFQFTVIYLSLTLGKQVEDTLPILLPLQLLLTAEGCNILSSSSMNCQNLSRGIPRTIN